MHHADHMIALKNIFGRKHSQLTRSNQRSSRSRLRLLANQFTIGQSTRSTMNVFALWIVAIVIFALGLSSLLRQHLPSIVSGQNSSTQQNNSSVNATTHAIFRVEGITITDTQWHDAVQSAFEARASSGQYLGGTQVDNDAINTQAIHAILDPIAQQKVIKGLGLTTNSDVLYQQWLAQASLQEQQTAQQNQGNVNYKQQMVQEQLEKNVVSRQIKLTLPDTSDAYTYYLQNPALFARTAPQMHIQQIVVASLQAAQQVANQLKLGTPFSVVEAADDVSGSFYHAHSGDLGWLALGGSGYPPEWTANVLSLKAGQVGAPFQVNGRYYIVKCLEGPDYEPSPFSQVQEQARTDLAQAQLNVAFATILSQQEKRMHIVFIDKTYTTIINKLLEVSK